MTKWLSILLHFFLSLFRTRRDLAFENLLLRQQLAVLKEKGARPQLSATDRSFWVVVARLWPKWRVGCELVIKLLLEADTNHGSVSSNDNHPGARYLTWQ